MADDLRLGDVLREDLSLDELTRLLFPNFDHEDESEVNMAVWEKLRETVGEQVAEMDGNYYKRMVERDGRP